MRGQFGGMIAARRKAKRLTLRKLGELVGLSPSYLSEIETGRKMPPSDDNIIEKIAQVLEVTPAKMKAWAIDDRKEGRVAGVLSSIFGENNDLAFSLYRATEGKPENELSELREKLKKFFKELEGN